MIISYVCSQLEKSMLLFISTFCKINFGSVDLNTEFGQQAILLMVGMEIKKHMLRALWILQNIVGQESVFCL